MLLGALAMPLVGFLPAGVAVFLAILALAQYDPWTTHRRIVFPLVGVAIVVGFYVLFSEALLVPLPVGSLFEDRKSTRLNSQSLMRISYAVFCLNKKTRYTLYNKSIIHNNNN